MKDSIRVFELNGLDEEFDDDLAKSILEIRLDKILHPQEAVEKSLYNFDLETPEGVDRLLELLPILDPEIVNEVYQEIFPGYPVDELAPRMARLELRGYLMDYLEDEERQKAGQEAAAPEGLGEDPLGAEGSEEPAPGLPEDPGAEGVPSPSEPTEEPDPPQTAPTGLGQS